MSFKNKKEYKEAKKKWKSSATQQRSPAGYKTFQEKESAFKKGGKKGESNNDLKVKSKGSGLKTKSTFNSKKFKQRDAEFKRDMEDRIKDAKSYKPKSLKLSKKQARPITSKNLPKRPKAPKMPTINLPNGSLITDKIANPSGLAGKSKTYSTKTLGKSDLKSAYTGARVDGAADLQKFKKRVKG